VQKVGLAHGIGLTKVGRNTKLHAVCGAKDRPVVLPLTPGNVHDYKVAQLGIDAMPPPDELVADKGYDSQALREWLVERGTQPVIPPRKNRKSSTTTTQSSSPKRNIIERRFCRLKERCHTPSASTGTSNPSWAQSLSSPASSGGCEFGL